MRKKRRNALVVAAILIVLGVTWLVLHPTGPDPIYREKPLSYWLHGFIRDYYGQGSYPGSPFRFEAQEAVRGVGSNAVPTLLRMLKGNEIKAVDKMILLCRKQSVIRFSVITSEERLAEVNEAFQELESAGKDAIPELMRTFRKKSSVRSQWVCAASLSVMGPDAVTAVPMLLEGVANTDPNVSDVCGFALAKIHPNAEMVVPPLAKYLEHPSAHVRKSSAFALGSYGAEAKSAVPALLRMLNDPDMDNRAMATNCMRRIDPEAAAKAGIK